MNTRPSPEAGVDRDEFFIGYAPPMPPGLARFVRKIVIGLAGAVAVWAVLLATGHVPLEGGTFEFGRPRQFAGTIVEWPYPALRPDGDALMTEDLLLLVAPGKHGAGAMARGLDGRRVTLTGTRVRRGSQIMIEVDPASLQVAAGPGASPASAVIGADAFDERSVQVRGEIVDSKCFLGVMVPGAGKTHKDCASLCLRGGIPPALYVQDRDGASALMLLTGPGGEPLGAQTLRLAGEAVDVSGMLERRGGWLVLRTDPATWKPLAR